MMTGMVIVLCAGAALADEQIVQAAEPATPQPSEAPAATTAPTAGELEAVNADRTTLHYGAMWTLGIWAVANIGVGTWGAIARPGVEGRFWEGNALWNTVNLLIAAIALIGREVREPAPALSLEATRAAATQNQWVLLLNAALDLAYVATGGFLWERGLRTREDRLTGYGQALVLQGGFLLLFDIAQVVLGWIVTGDLDEVGSANGSPPR